MSILPTGGKKMGKQDGHGWVDETPESESEHVQADLSTTGTQHGCTTIRSTGEDRELNHRQLHDYGFESTTGFCIKVQDQGNKQDEKRI